MQWDYYKTNKLRWHRWFAWYPVRTGSWQECEVRHGSSYWQPTLWAKCVWWEWVERKIERGRFKDFYSYRLPTLEADYEPLHDQT